VRLNAPAVLLLAALGFAACGDDRPAQPTVDVPPWAKVAPEQIAEAKKHGVSVAFENDIGMRFVLIPAGTFLMGSPETEVGHEVEERQYKVTITKPFYLQVTEVTNGQYRRYRPAHDSGSHASEAGTRYPLSADDQPAVNLSWEDARRFAAWLGERATGRKYRLPTEAEWEWSARASTNSRRYFGDEDDKLVSYANFSDKRDPESVDEERSELDDGHAVAAPVATYAPNAWGLYDMLGNVYEWVQDYYGPYPSEPQRDPVGPATGDERVLRGASWVSDAVDLRAAFRNWSTPDDRFEVYGFRLVSPLPDK